MASWFGNTTATSSFNPALTGVGRYVASGEKWGGSFGTGVVLTYSFPSGLAYRTADYGSGEWAGWSALRSGERTAAVSALNAWAAVSNVHFQRVSDNEAVVGEIRFAYTSHDTDDEAAHAYYPAGSVEAGDVWLSWRNFNSSNTATIAKGSDDFHTLLHELGHSLGLKHSFETPSAAPAAKENYFYSVMSYTASPWSDRDDAYASFYPTTPMYYDLVAMQAMYGRNLAHNRGNSTYTFLDGKTYFETIDDAGGIDAIVYSGADKVTINLNIGAFSTVSEAIRFTDSSSRAAVAIGPNSNIENATGGRGNDTLIGNALANRLNGNTGNDVLSGHAGNDALYGGGGNDRLSGGVGADRFYFNTALSSTSNSDRIIDYNVAADSIYVENGVFTRLSATGVINAAFFRVGSAAADGNDFIIYNRSTGVLSYDADGSGQGAAIKFAVMATGLSLTNADIIVF